MSQTQYLKIIERELQRVNQEIDFKILRGQDYKKEARDHKLLLKKVRYHTRKGLLKRFFQFFLRSNRYA
jgi:hypothetical protein